MKTGIEWVQVFKSMIICLHIKKKFLCSIINRRFLIHIYVIKSEISKDVHYMIYDSSNQADNR